MKTLSITAEAVKAKKKIITTITTLSSKAMVCGAEVYKGPLWERLL